MFRYIFQLQVIISNYRYNKEIYFFYEMDFNQFYTTRDGFKYSITIYPFSYSLRNTPINVIVEVHSRVYLLNVSEIKRPISATIILVHMVFP